MNNRVTINEIVEALSNVGVSYISGSSYGDKIVTKVTVLDAPDGPQWLKGGELVLTSAFMFANGVVSLVDFTRELIRVGASGLGIKTTRFLSTIPSELIDLSEEEGFPILLIPSNLVWSDVIDVFYLAKENQHKESWLDKDDVLWLNSLHASEKTTVPFFLAKLTSAYPVYAYYFSKDLEIKNIMFAKNVPQREHEELIAKIRSGELAHVPGEISQFGNLEYCISDMPSYLTKDGGFFLFIATERPVLIKILLLLTVLDESALEEKRSLQQAPLTKEGYIMSLVKGTQKATDHQVLTEGLPYSAQARYFVMVILSGRSWREGVQTIRDVIASPGLLGLSTGSAGSSVWVAGDLGGASSSASSGDSDVSGVSSSSGSSGFSGAAGQRSQHIYAADFSYYHDDPNQVAYGVLQFYLQDEGQLLPIIRQIMSTALSEMEDQDSFIVCGNVYHDAVFISDSYRDAMQLINLRSQLYWHMRCIYYFDHAFVTGHKPEWADKSTFSDIAMLRKKEPEYGFDPVMALLVFLSSGNYKESADRLHIHENTLRYRIRKINEVLAIDLSDDVNRLALLQKVMCWVTEVSKSV